jgi:hypothetical protein
MESILAFITPCPLAERCEFSTRVLTSWLSLGLVLGLVLGIASLSSGTADPASAFFGSLLAGPLIICVFGLLGLGISSLRGDKNYHPGWYWYLFPIVTYILIGFWLALTIIAFAFALVGISTPKSSYRPSRSSPKIDPEKFRKEVENLKVEDLLKEFQEELEQLEQLNNQRKLEPEQEKVVRKLRSFDRSKYDHRLRDVFEEEELEKLIILLLILLGVEVR